MVNHYNKMSTVAGSSSITSDSSRVPSVLFRLRFLILATSSVSSRCGLRMFFLSYYRAGVSAGLG